MREIERDLAKIQQVENEYNFLQLTLNEKTRKAQEMNSRLKLDEGSNSASTLAERERELLKIKDNYESTMVSLNERRSRVEKLIKEQRELTQST